jgi:hypothetical protein
LATVAKERRHPQKAVLVLKELSRTHEGG